MCQDIGKIVILNGTPRSGKSSIANEMIHSFPGLWINLGVDHHMKMYPKSVHPGIGLRPGGERPDLEENVLRLYLSLFDSIAAHSRRGVNIAVDIGLHEDYQTLQNLRARCFAALDGLPVLLVGVKCPLDIIMKRRESTWNQQISPDGAIPPPVLRWQEQVHLGMNYDMQFDTSQNTPIECAQKILQHLESR